MNKALFKYCNDNLRDPSVTRLKITLSLKRLNQDYGFGSLDDKFCYFCDDDKNHLIALVEKELGVHLFRDIYPVRKSRIDNAAKYRNEKENTLTVTNDFVLVNSLGRLCLNQSSIGKCSVKSLGTFICASEVNSIEHSHVVFVENLAVMANLSLLKIPKSLKNALWLYRGDIQAHKNTSTASQFFKRFKKSNILVCFSDLDPKGLEIAITCGAKQWLTIADKNDLNIKLKGHENEWFNQKTAITYLNKQQLPPHQKSLFEEMKKTKKTLKQEHMLSYGSSLDCFDLV